MRVGFIMKLRLSQQQEDDRPTSLTLDFFSSLMTAESKRNGVFQILSFARKRERVFSTKLNDGFFTLKVMFVNEAADQLELGLINENYLLSGSIRNHGEGVIVIKEAVKYWEHGKEVGHPVTWRLKKENVNFKGSNLVAQTTQKLTNLHSNASQIMVDYGIYASSEKKTRPMSSIKKPPSQKKKKKDDSLGQNIENEMKFRNFTQQSVTKSVIGEKTLDFETQAANPEIGNDKKLSTPKNQSKEQRIQAILQFLITDNSSDEEQEQFILPDRFLQKKLSTNKKKMQERKNDLQFIFNCLSDTESEQQNIVDDRTVTLVQNKENQKDNDQDINDQEFLEWIQQKKSQQKRTYSQQQEPTVDRKLSRDKVSMNSVRSVQAILQVSIDKEKVTFENLYNGYVKKSASWHCEAIIKCIHHENQAIYAIICDKTHQYLIFASFINIKALSFPLEENKLYKLGNGLIRQSLTHKINHSNFDIQFDCKSSILEERDEEILDAVQSSRNYTPIQRIYQIEEGLIINCFGILKDFKSFKGKTGNTLHYEIVDPITRWSINFVQFQSHLNTESVRCLVDKSITIYGVMTSSYKNKPNLVRKPFTIVKHEWLPLTKEARDIFSWTKQCNSVAHLETELVGYMEVNELKDIQDEVGNNFFIKNVEIIQFKDKYTYRACTTCMKKVQDGRCRNCGFRKLGQIADRLFLRGEIGDLSATISVLWSNSMAEILMSNGFGMMKMEWILRPISVWMDRSSNNTITIVKMKIVDKRQDITNLLNEISRNLLKK